MIDYTKYPDGDRFYSGAERKKSIMINGNAIMVEPNPAIPSTVNVEKTTIPIKRINNHSCMSGFLYF